MRIPAALRASLLCALAALSASAAFSWVPRDEVTLEGRFFDPQIEESLVAVRVTHGLELWRGEEVVWSEGFHAYLSEVFGTCRDLGTGRDRIFFATSSGGSDGAMTIHLLAFVPGRGIERVFTDLTSSPELGRYFRLPEPQADRERLEPVAGMICAAEDYRARRKRGLETLAALAPSAEPSPLELDDNQRLVPQTLVARDLDPALVRSLLQLHDDLGEGFARATLAETERWRFELVAFYHAFASWGVLLLEDKQSGGWRSILRVPRGDSKSFLLEPAIVAVGPGTAEIDLCAVCPNWPAAPAAILDLGTLRLLPASGQQAE